MLEGKSPPNISWLTSKRPPSDRITSKAFPCSPTGLRRTFQVSRTGATTRLPAISPSHQVSQIDPRSTQRAKPPENRLKTPHVALTVVLITPASTMNQKRLSG